MRRRRRNALYRLSCMLVALTALIGHAEAAPEEMHLAGLDVFAWLPDPASSGPWPVVIFSHGFHGCATQSKFLMEALAESGYAVFAPNHRDAACADLRAWMARPETPFRDTSAWSDATYADREADIETLLGALAADPRFGAAPFDLSHVALAGHSLGGYTVLGLAGAWPRWKDPRIKAVLALSPFSAPFIRQKTLAGLEAPVMYQGGTRDPGITPTINHGNGAYPQSPKPKFYVEFDGAGHFAWTDLRSTYHKAIIAYSRAFLDHTLKGEPFPTALASPHRDVAEIRIDE